MILGLSSHFLFAGIEAGNSIRLEIKGVPAGEKAVFDGMYPVGEKGTINVPHIGRIKAAGLTSEDLSDSIQTALKEGDIFTTPVVQVFANLKDIQPQAEKLHVGGQVKKPGAVAFTKNLTLFQAVQSAGGETEFGTLTRVELHRNGKMTKLNLKDNSMINTLAQPGDTLVVPQKNFINR